MKKSLFIFAVLTVVTFGGNYEDGLNAFNTGDYDQAVVLWKKSADQGYVKAKYNLGVMYVSGRGVKQDYKKAVDFWNKAADEGHAAAQYNLGVMYESGTGVTQDYNKAATFYKKATAQGLAKAKLNLEALLLKMF